MSDTFFALPPGMLPGGVLAVLRAARTLDAWEIQETSEPGPLVQKTALFEAADLAWVYGQDAQSIAMLACHQIAAGQWSVGFCATEAWPTIGLAVTRHIQRQVIPQLLELGLKTAIAAPLAGRVQTHRWLEHLGFRLAKQLPEFGRSGTDFCLYRWQKSEQSAAPPEASSFALPPLVNPELKELSHV